MSTQLIKLNIDGKEIEFQQNKSILQIALDNGIYIPTLCYHPDLPPFGACGLCAVEIDGLEETVLSCDTIVKQGMKVSTNTPKLKKIRQEKLAKILANHPHACLVCAEKEGCAREPCSLNVPVSERCCVKLGDCELERVADYIGIPENTPRYKPQELPRYEDNPLIIRDYNLCIGCGRCIRACSSLRGYNVLGELPDPSDLIDPSIFPKKLEDSGCQFCRLCVEVCPTGALLDRIKKVKGITPCQNDCPAHIDIPKFLREIYEKKFPDALTTMYYAVPFPGTLGYVCNYPCEVKCRRGELDDAVAIRILKKLVFENFNNNIKFKGKIAPSDKKIAVIGAGPAGLSCAFFLAQWGHKVDVFEARKKPGGMLRYGIPSFRLPRKILDREIKIIKQNGVDIKLNSPISSVNDLLNNGYNAVFVGIGAQKGQNLNIEGENDPRVIDGLNFLNAVFSETDVLKNISSNKKIKVGSRVAIIGGGNTAIDTARTAKRFGAQVTLFYRRSEEEMPAYKEEIEAAKKEGVSFKFLSLPIKILPKKNLLKVEFIKMKLGPKDKSGRSRPIPIEDSSYYLEFDILIKAIGQTINPIKGLNIDKTGWLAYDNNTLKLKEGVYGGGDIFGTSSVVEAIAMGRKAAVEIHLFLGGVEEETTYSIEKPFPIYIDMEEFLVKRVRIPTINISNLLNNFESVELSIKKEEGVKEAARCLQCDLCSYLSTVPYPPADLLPFILENILKIPEKSGVYILFDKEKNVIEIKGTANLRQILEEKLGAPNNIKFFKYEEDPMYSKRESELLQQYIQQHGKMPSSGDELDDLF